MLTARGKAEMHKKPTENGRECLNLEYRCRKSGTKRSRVVPQEPGKVGQCLVRRIAASDSAGETPADRAGRVLGIVDSSRGPSFPSTQVSTTRVNFKHRTGADQ